MKRMLINATHSEELRVALVDGQRLYDLDVENRNRESKKANIYKGKITRVEPSLEAAFVDYGSERHGFLPLKEIAREYMQRGDGGRFNIRDVKVGTEVIVQVDKEERGNKGAALTTFVSLAGRYLVLMPNNPRAGGISRRIDGDERADLKDALSEIEIPEGMGVIVRTAGIGRSPEELTWDMNYLMQIWTSIKAEADACSAPHFLFQESNVIIRAVRDYMRDDISEVIVDSEVEYQLAKAFISQVMPPAFQSRIRHYTDSTPLFNRYQIESQIETAYQREVKLPSGGSIVIDVTEALISIDINSSRATKGGDIEETALNTNLEAADEIARQLRIRDIGGLIVIDFIDMSSTRNQKDVENRLQAALESDRARVQIGRISRFGLLEMSRQRLRPSLAETSGKVCPQCMGQGTIRDTKSVALSILRLLEEEAQKERSGEIRAIAPVSVATFLLNEKRRAIHDIEVRNGVRVVVLPKTDMVLPHFDVIRLRDDDEDLETLSFNVSLTKPEEIAAEEAAKIPVKVNVPAVQNIVPSTPAPQVASREKTNEAATSAQPGLIGKVIQWFKSLLAEEPVVEAPKKPTQPQRHDRNRGRNDQRNGQRQDSRNGRNRNDNRNRGERDSQPRDSQPRDSQPRDSQQRGPRNDQQRGDQARGERSPRPEGQRQGNPRQDNRPPRNDRPPRPPRPEQPDTGIESGNEIQPMDARPPRPERGERPPRGQGRDQGRQQNRGPRDDRRPQSGERRPQGDRNASGENGIETVETPAFVPVADLAARAYAEENGEVSAPQQQRPAPAPRPPRPAAPAPAPLQEQQREVAPPPAPPKPARVPGERVSNDPRKNPQRDRVIEIVTESVQHPVPVIPTELAQTKTVERPRPPNDPRAKRAQSSASE